MHWSPAGRKFEPAPNKSLTHAVARPDYTGDDGGEAGADDDDGGGSGVGDDAGQQQGRILTHAAAKPVS